MTDVICGAPEPRLALPAAIDATSEEPAGDYVIVGTTPDGATSTEKPATVTAGERLELTVE